MNQWKKALSVCFAVFLLLTATVAGTLANGAGDSGSSGGALLSEAGVELVQLRRGYDNGDLTLQEIPADNGSVDLGDLLPLVGSVETGRDQYGLPTAEGYVDNIVYVKNNGNAAVYVRVVMAIPAALDGVGALHWDSGSGDTEQISCDRLEGELTRDGVKYNTYVFTYRNALASGSTTEAAAIVGFYLDSKVNVVDGHVLLDGVDTHYTEDTVKIYIKAQAVQRDGFDSAEAAFKAAEMSTIPWS